MDKSNFVIDKVRRIMQFDSNDSSALINLTQIEDLSLKASADNTEVKDALGMTIMELQRAKKLEISGTSSLFDFALMAAQFGTQVEDSSAVLEFAVPRFDTYTYSSTKPTFELAKEVETAKLGTGIQKFVYKLHPSGEIKQKYGYAATASATEFTMVTTGGKTTFTPPTDSVNGDVFLITYEYIANETQTASRVVNSGTAQTKAGRLMAECLFRDTCNKNNVYYGFAVCDNADIDANVDISLKSDGKHPFMFKANPAYCSTEKQLLTFIIPDKEAAA